MFWRNGKTKELEKAFVDAKDKTRRLKEQKARLWCRWCGKFICQEDRETYERLTMEYRAARIEEEEANRLVPHMNSWAKYI